MNKKQIIKILGVFTAAIALCGTALSCHLFSKKTADPKDTDKKNKEDNSVIKEEKEKKDYVEMKTMYGIPMEDTTKSKDDDTIIRDIIIIEKYAIPNIPKENVRILKYAVPKIISVPEKSVKKYAVPNNPPVAKYALPEYMNNENIEKYAVPNIEEIPVLKYATPYFPPDDKNNGSEVNLPMYALPYDEDKK